MKILSYLLCKCCLKDKILGPETPTTARNNDFKTKMCNEINILITSGLIWQEKSKTWHMRSNFCQINSFSRPRSCAPSCDWDIIIPPRGRWRWLFLLAAGGAWSRIPPHRHMMRAFGGGVVFRFMMGQRSDIHTFPQREVGVCVRVSVLTCVRAVTICTPACLLRSQPWGERPGESIVGYRKASSLSTLWRLGPHSFLRLLILNISKTC